MFAGLCQTHDDMTRVRCAYFTLTVGVAAFSSTVTFLVPEAFLKVMTPLAPSLSA